MAFYSYSQNHVAHINMCSYIPIEKIGMLKVANYLSCTPYGLYQYSPATFVRMTLFLQKVLFINTDNLCRIHLESVEKFSQI